jgi:hypothetical protein
VFLVIFVSVSSVFRRMLQVLYLDVLKVDRCCISLLSPQCLLLLPAPAEHPPPPSTLLDVGDIWGVTGPAWVWEMDCRRGRARLVLLLMDKNDANL